MIKKKEKKTTGLTPVLSSVFFFLDEVSPIFDKEIEIFFENLVFCSVNWTNFANFYFVKFHQNFKNEK